LIERRQFRNSIGALQTSLSFILLQRLKINCAEKCLVSPIPVQGGTNTYL
jgi:hypothetical protein